MEPLNHAFFLWLNTPEHPNTLVVTLAIFFAEWLIWAAPALIGIGWLCARTPAKRCLSPPRRACWPCSSTIGLSWSHPRPFMIGLGHTLIPHVADSLFPSDHLTLWWAVAFSLLLQRGLRSAGVALALLGAPIAWARIYLGVHFPLDMLGAAVVAAFSAWLALREARRYLGPI